MNTQIAYQQYLTTAQQNADYINTLLWILFTFVVIAPLILGLIVVVVLLILRHKNPCVSEQIGA